MKTYILKEGAQSILNGIGYKAGEAVTTNIPLMKMWPNRFSLAPAGIKGVKWPEDVNDVVGTDKFAVICNRDRSTFKIVDAQGKAVEGCAVLLRDAAFKKYRELMGIKKVVKEEKKEEKKEDIPPEDDEDEEEEETPKKSKKDEDEEESDEEESDDGDDDEIDEEEEDEKPLKNAVKKHKKDKVKSKKR